MIRDFQKEGNFIGVIGLCCAVGLGFFIEFFYQEKPCALCFLQRGIMLGAAFGLYLNLAKGIRIRHYAFSLLWILLGFLCSLRHMGLNVCKKLDVVPFLFLSHRIYTWALIVFLISFCGILALLFLYKPLEDDGKKDKHPSKGLKIVSGVVLLATLSFAAFSILLRRGFTF